jgi:glycosyltransferase involved in cell wall biosynthesis
VRILIYPHSMEIGGSQLNAVELGGALARRGHDILVFGEDGPLVDLVHTLGLTHLGAPRPRFRPSPAVMNRLCGAVRQGRIDLVHAFEWPPAMEAVYGPLLRLGTPAVCTVMSMAVARFIPAGLPLTVGTVALAETERARRSFVTVLEPPVDTDLNRPIHPSTSRASFGVADGDFLVVLVSRLAPQLKREGILDAVRAAGALADRIPLRLLIAGDGPSRPEIERAARQANTAAGRDVVTLTGNLADPRPAYDAADVVLGMGGSALRAMAFAKPVVVQGERGYWRLLDRSSLPEFLHQGWYGVGSGQDGSALVAAIMQELYQDPDRRRRLGEFARATVVQRYSLAAAADAQEALYTAAIGTVPSRRRIAPALVRPFAQVAGYEVRRKVSRWRGRAAADDFNTLQAMSTPLTARSRS